MRDPMQTVRRINEVLRGLPALKVTPLEVRLSSYHYEDLLIIKGLPHGLGQLNSYGPYYDRRPLKTYAKLPLQFIAIGPSYVLGLSSEGKEERYGLI